MAIIPLTDPQSNINFFRRRVLLNIQYWQDYVATNATDVAALDSQRNSIIRAISLALELEEAWPVVYELITAFSSYMERRGYWETWNWILSQAIEAAQRVKDMGGEITLSALLARLLQREGHFKQAIANYRCTIRLSRRVGDHFNEARACTNLGYLYIEKGYWYRSEVLCCHALNIFEAIDSDHGRAHTENHLGILYTRQRFWDKAQHHLERACAIWQSTGDDFGLIYGFMNLGLLYKEMENPGEALKHLEIALAKAIETRPQRQDDYTTISWTQQADRADTIYADIAYELGKLYVEQSHWYDGLNLFEESLTIRRQSDDLNARADTIYHIARTHHLIGNLDRARLHYRDALRLYERVGNPRGLAACKTSLGRLAIQLGFLTDATQEFKQALHLYMDLGEIEQVNKIEEILQWANNVKEKQAK